MVRDINIDIWLCACLGVNLWLSVHGGSSQASHIPVVKYLLYGSTANF